MLTTTVVHLLFGICVNRFGSVATMHGGSMEPTLHSGGNEPFGYLKADLLYLDKMSLRNYTFSRGDVVVFRSPLEPKMWLVKRLIALPSDWVTVPGTYEILQVCFSFRINSICICYES
jgi:inner membrane protease subunit 2